MTVYRKGITTHRGKHCAHTCFLSLAAATDSQSAIKSDDDPDSLVRAPDEMFVSTLLGNTDATGSNSIFCLIGAVPMMILFSNGQSCDQNIKYC